jgi:2-polyprenyl-3-methyl-5-hydroxy-6-metoxy-1,4-benzoquinol methylase
MANDPVLRVANDAPTVERCSCPMCGSDRAEETRFSDGPYRVARCRECRLWYLRDRLPERVMLEAYADDDYFEGGGGGYAAYDSQEQSLTATFSRLLRRLSAMGATGGSVLDVGCGYGYFLAAATGYYGRRCGTDFSPRAAEIARRSCDEVWLGGVEDIPPGEKFSVVVALHVVEHVYDPVAFVARLIDRIRDGGHLVLAAPDMGSFWRHLMGRRWPSLKLPEHVAFYDRSTLAALVRTDPRVTEVRGVPYASAFPLGEVLA